MIRRGVFVIAETLRLLEDKKINVSVAAAATTQESRSSRS